MSAPIRVILADDHPLVRAGIRSALTLHEQITLVGESADGPTTLRLCAEQQPEIVLLDLNMPESPPATTVARLRAECPDTQIIILSAYDDDAFVRGLTTAGIAGYILKDEALEVVGRAIENVARGDTWFSRNIVVKLAAPMTATPRGNNSPRLTNRERQILVLLLEAHDARQIATSLSLSEQTVRNYLSRLYDKLNVNSRAEAICWARDNKFVAA